MFFDDEDYKKDKDDKRVDGRCRICGRSGTLIWTDGGKLVCTACDNPQWG